MIDGDDDEDDDIDGDSVDYEADHQRAALSAFERINGVAAGSASDLQRTRYATRQSPTASTTLAALANRRSLMGVMRNVASSAAATTRRAAAAADRHGAQHQQATGGEDLFGSFVMQLAGTTTSSTSGASAFEAITNNIANGARRASSTAAATAAYINAMMPPQPQQQQQHHQQPQAAASGHASGHASSASSSGASFRNGTSASAAGESSNARLGGAGLSPLRHKVVYQLRCMHCAERVCNRAMKAILLADTKIELYSTDIPPMMQLMEEDRMTQGCNCRIRDTVCMGCGNVLGYHVSQPCDRCLDAKNNGHFWMFYSETIFAYERPDPSAGGKPLYWGSLSPMREHDEGMQAKCVRYELYCR